MHSQKSPSSKVNKYTYVFYIFILCYQFLYQYLVLHISVLLISHCSTRFYYSTPGGKFDYHVVVAGINAQCSYQPLSV